MDKGESFGFLTLVPRSTVGSLLLIVSGSKVYRTNQFPESSTVLLTSENIRDRIPDLKFQISNFKFALSARLGL